MNFPLNDRFASQNNKDKNFLKYGFKEKKHLAQFFENLTDFKKGKKKICFLAKNIVGKVKAYSLKI